VRELSKPKQDNESALVTVTVQIHKKMAELIESTLKRNPWLAYENLEEFFLEAGRRYMENLLELEALERKVKAK